MKALPLVTRELLAEARRPFNYWLRVLGAGIVIIAFVLTTVGLEVSPGRYGIYLFRSLNTALSIAIWVLVPVVTADCVSREKREGTLGLLFLTPLSASDILIGKVLTHGARAFTLILAALPLIGLPFMLGGISWAWAINTTLSHLAALLLALAAGLMASVRNAEWTRALVSAELLSGCFWIPFGIVGSRMWEAVGPWYCVGLITLALLVVTLLKELDSMAEEEGAVEPQALAFTLPPLLITGPKRQLRPVPLLATFTWAVVGAAGLLGTLALGWSGFGRLYAAVVVFFIAVRTSAECLRETWQDDMGPPPEPAWVSLFANSDLWQSFFQWDESRTRDRNPVAWLQEYSWTARLTKWGWCSTAIIAEMYGVVTEHGFAETQRWLSALLMIGLAFSAAGSFRRERQTGALELLLVTPLREWHVLGGRLWGIWGHFLPAMSIALVCWWMVPFGKGPYHSWWAWGCLSSYLCLPLIGLYFSLKDINFLMAWLLTAVLGLLVPALVLLSVSHYTQVLLQPSWICSIQIAVALAAAWMAYHSLRDRQFVSLPVRRTT